MCIAESRIYAAAGLHSRCLMVLLGGSGGEFKAAIEEAQAVQARIVFGDRPVEITSSRMASRVGFRVRLPVKTPSADSE